MRLEVLPRRRPPIAFIPNAELFGVVVMVSQGVDMPGVPRPKVAQAIHMQHGIDFEDPFSIVGFVQ